MNKIYYFLLLYFTPQFLVAQPWQTLADIPADLAFPVVVELRGNIHVIGGGSTGGATDLHLRYTPATNIWDTLPPVPYLAQQPAGAVVNDRIHFCGGGYPTTGQRLDLHYYYDPDSVQWFQAANLPVATAIHKATAYDGKLYVLSGQPDKALCEYYDPGNDTWYQKNPLPDQDYWYGALVSTSQTIFRFGGGAYFAPSKKAHRYNQLTDSWIPLPDLPIALHALAGVAMNDSMICISGGYGSSGETDKVWIYNINTQQYLPSDSLPVARNYHSMVKIDSCVYSVGGYKAGIPAIGTSLIKNCAPVIISAIADINKDLQKPYTMHISPSGIQIQIKEHALNTGVEIKLTDISGKIIKQHIAGKNDTFMMIENKTLINGMYAVILVIDNRIFTEKWVVIR